jgi:hypothetical protein
MTLAGVDAVFQQAKRDLAAARLRTRKQRSRCLVRKNSWCGQVFGREPTDKEFRLD